MDFLSAITEDDNEHSQAAGWVTALFCVEDVSTLLPALDTWLGERPSHRDAFGQAQLTWQLSKLFLAADHPSAGRAEIQAFFDALDEARSRYPGYFADS